MMVVMLLLWMTATGRRIIIVGSGSSSKVHCLNFLCNTTAKYSFGYACKTQLNGSSVLYEPVPFIYRKFFLTFS